MSILVIGHAGHWAVQLVLFAPVTAFVLWLLVVQIRDRMRGGPWEEEEGYADAEEADER